jgi:hypothetical protein
MNDSSSRLKSFLGMTLFGSIFMLVGAVIVLFSIDVIHVPDENFNAPRWVVAAAGAVFMLAGMLPMLNGLKEFSGGDTSFTRLLYNLAMLGFLLLFSVPFNWVAFWPGEREFSSSSSVGGFNFASSGGSILSGRCVFGLAAIFIDFLLVYMVIRFLRGENLSHPGRNANRDD